MNSTFETRRLGWRFGFSLVEAAIVLGVFSVILGSTWAIVSNVRENVHRQQAAEQITTIVNGVRDLYQGKPNITDTNYVTMTASLINAGVIPRDMVRPETLFADHPWGPTGSAATSGGVRVRAEGASDHKSFRINLLGLKRSSCIAMVTKISTLSGATGLREISINGGDKLPVPVNVSDASDSSNGCYSAANNSVSYIFWLRRPSS